LAQCHRLDGLKAVDVRAKLGLPRESFRRPRRGNRAWSYSAGHTDSGFFAPTDQTLDVELGRDGRVRRATIEDHPIDD
jgi:hypothetical protein